MFVKNSNKQLELQYHCRKPCAKIIPVNLMRGMIFAAFEPGCFNSKHVLCLELFY